jgi:pilus assembly protein Flp/PilA
MPLQAFGEGALNKLKEQEEETMEWLKKFWRDEEGTQVTETAIVLGLISIASIAVLTVLGPQVAAIFQSVSDDLP